MSVFVKKTAGVDELFLYSREMRKCYIRSFGKNKLQEADPSLSELETTERLHVIHGMAKLVVTT